MSTVVKLIGLVLLSVSVSILPGCEGEQGAAGPEGPQGPAGTPGTSWQGNIDTNTTWDAASGPYVLEQNIVVKAGATLTVAAGTTVRLNPSVILYVDGTLNAQGTAGSHITFRNEGTLNCTNCVFDNFSEGVYCDPNASVTLTGCAVTNFTAAGIQNMGTVTLTNGNLFGTATYAYYNGSTANQTATGSWWGTANAAVIDTLIFDQNDSGTFGLVDYSGFQSGPVSVTGCGW